MPNPRTPYEKDAIQLIAKGMSYRQVAEALGIGSGTVARIAQRAGMAKPKKLTIVREGINYAAEAANLRW